MSLVELAKRDMLDIVTDPDGWGVKLAFTAPTGHHAEIYGLSTKHNMALNPEGTQFNSKIASVAVSEYSLRMLNYPCQDKSGRVSLVGHLVAWVDSHGDLVTYKVKEQLPDEALGLIVLILADHVAPVKKNHTCT